MDPARAQTMHSFRQRADRLLESSAWQSAPCAMQHGKQGRRNSAGRRANVLSGRLTVRSAFRRRSQASVAKRRQYAAAWRVEVSVLVRNIFIQSVEVT